jgi:tetratricopeptide (TPR) repeat protein
MKQSLILIAFVLCSIYCTAQITIVDTTYKVRTVTETPKPGNSAAADALWRKADKLYHQKKYLAALDTINKAIGLAPDYAEIISFSYYPLVKLKRFDEALTMLERAHTLDPTVGEYLQDKGNILHELKQVDSAKVYYQQAIEENPHDERYYYNYIYLLAEMRDFESIKTTGVGYEVGYDEGEITKNADESRADIFFYMALAYQYTNDTSKAIDYYSKAIDITPYSAYLSNRGLLYEDQKNYALALADYNKIIELLPGQPDGYFNRARVYEEMDLNNKALADLQKAKSLGKNDADLNNNLGNVYKHLKYNKLARKAYERVLALDPKNTQVRNNLALLYKQMGNDSLSQQEYSHAIQAATAKEIPFYNQGFDLQKKGQPKQAIPYFDSAIHYKPNFMEAYNQLGLCYTELDKDSMAIIIFSKALKINPNYDLLYVNRAAAYKGLKNYTAAEADYKKAYELNPKRTIIFYTLAKLYNDIGDANKAANYFATTEKMGVDDIKFYIDYSAFLSHGHRYEKCIQVATTGIKKYPTNAALFNNRGGAYKDLDSTTRAIKDYETAIRLDPQDASACYNLGNTYLHAGNNEQAVSQYQQAIGINSSIYPFYLNLASAYQNMDEYDNAIATLAKAIQLTPKCSDAYFNRGAIYRDLQQMDKAIKDYDMALDLLERFGPCNHDVAGSTIEKDKSTIMLKKAAIYQSTLRFDKANQAYEAYLNFNTTDADAYDNYGYCLLEAGKVTEAKKALERAYQLDKKNPDILVGLIAVHYVLNNKTLANTYKQALWTLKPKLSKTAASLEMLEHEGYSYTPAFKKIFADCF